MKKICLLVSAVLIFLTLPFFNTPGISAVETPVKIGLHYGSGAKSQIDISAEKGTAFVSFDEKANKYDPVYSAGAGEIITVAKDSSLHVQIPGKYAAYNDAAAMADNYSQKGVEAYAVYDGSGWSTWAGFYADKAAAETAATDIKSKLGQQECSVIDISNIRIYGTNRSGKAVFMYASEKNFLRGKPLSDKVPNIISIGGVSYRGEVEFRRQANSDMTVINVLPFEEYLYGVVPNEIEAYSHVEALKAQAVAARSYAYKSINKHSAYGFNLCTTTDCQVYRGYGSESEATNKAIDDTKNVVVTYNGAIAETVFFSSSGGKTESAVNVWGFDIAYLRSVEDPHESGQSYMYRWNLTFTLDEISQKLKSYGVGTVTGMEITKYTETGRPVEIIVRGTEKPEGVVITRDRCRTFLSLYSQWYTMTTNADIDILVEDRAVKTQLSQVRIMTTTGQKTYTDPAETITVVGADGNSKKVSLSPTEYSFTGKGWGHSVGMSQEGAKGMANAGFTYEQILAHYYQGTKIELKK